MLADKISFLNVDFDLSSETSVREIVRLLEADLCVLHLEETSTTLELMGQPVSPEEAILQFAGIVRARVPPAIWEGCSRKVADVGVRLPRGVYQGRVRLSTQAMQALIELGMDLAMTVYEPEETS
jgi:hypothetical protein